MSFTANRYSEAQSDTKLIDVASTDKVRIIAVHLSVPAGQNAKLEFDAGTDVPIVSTETAVNLSGLYGQVVGAKGQDVLLTSSGAVSVAIVYEVASR